jgi:hypothetical protein
VRDRNFNVRTSLVRPFVTLEPQLIQILRNHDLQDAFSVMQCVVVGEALPFPQIGPVIPARLGLLAPALPALSMAGRP